MDNAGAFSLGDITITGPNTYDGTPITDLDGMSGYTAQAIVQPGPGSDADAAVAVYIKTSIDQGERWLDSAVMRFRANGVGVQVVSVQAKSTLEPIVPTTNAEADDSNSVIIDGILGDRLMATVVVTNGTLAGSSIVNVRVCVR